MPFSSMLSVAVALYERKAIYPGPRLVNPLMPFLCLVVERTARNIHAIIDRQHLWDELVVCPQLLRNAMRRAITRPKEVMKPQYGDDLVFDELGFEIKAKKEEDGKGVAASAE